MALKTQDHDTITTLPVSALTQQCADETRRFTRGQAYATEACFELFRRCIVAGDAEAWQAIHTQYEREVLNWVSHHPRFALTGESAEYFANGAFTRFFIHLTPEKFGHFPNLATLLRYLKLCVHGEVSDYPVAPTGELLETHAAPVPAEPGVLRADRNRFWQQIRALLHDPRELAVVYGSFVLDLKPREIHNRMPAEFTSVSEVYRTKANVLERLARAPELKHFLDGHA
jgi:hypothetical protein